MYVKLLIYDNLNLILWDLLYISLRKDITIVNTILGTIISVYHYF